MFEQYQKMFYMDFDGQRRAENYCERIIVSSSVIGLIIGYIYQQFSFTVISLGVGFILTSLISIIPWKMYRRCPLQWQKHNPAQLLLNYSGGDDNDEMQSQPQSNLSRPKNKK